MRLSPLSEVIFELGDHVMPVSASVSSAASVAAPVQSMDIETLLLQVQMQRSRLLDTQLTSQIQEVKNRNDQAALLNTAMAAINTVLAQYPKDGDNKAKIDGWNDDMVKKYEMPLNQALQAAGINNYTWESQTGQLPNGQKMITGTAVFTGSRTLGDIKGMQQFIQSKLDTLNSSQQLDMMQLQSLSNKRNEAYDVMTNFIKKMQDGRSSIISNMR